MAKNIKRKQQPGAQRAAAGDTKVKQPVSWGLLATAVGIVAVLVIALLIAQRNAALNGPTSTSQANTNQPTKTQTSTPAPAQTSQAPAKSWPNPPAMAIDLKKKYQAVVTTEDGTFTIDLWADKSPETVNNFVFLARQHFYDGIVFHRIIKSFMVQTGDPKGDGTGGPGYAIKDELPPAGPYDVGVVAMANAGANTGGSQFFICTGPDCAASLNQLPNYPQFGKVTSDSMAVVQKIAATPVTQSPTGEPSVPTQAVHMLKVEIMEK